MKRIRLNLRGQSDLDLALFAANHGRQADAQPEVYSGLDPDSADYAGLLAAYEGKLSELMAAETLYKRLVLEKNQARVTLENALRARSTRVCIIAGDDETAAGFKTAIRRGPRIGQLPAPQNVRVTMGSSRGRIDLKWRGVKGAKSYVVEWRFRDAANNTWGNQKVLTTPRLSISGLTSGVEYIFRMRAIGAAGIGPWSSEVVRMAP